MLGHNYPPLPSANTDPLFSFYPYPLSARETLHSSLRPSSSSRPRPSASNAHTAGPIRAVQPRAQAAATLPTRVDRAAAHARVVRRALGGRRPAGVDLGRDAADLSDEEGQLEAEKGELNNFGHRFLLPFGRRVTQMESEAAPSPTPSDPEHRQEDPAAHSPISPLHPSPGASPVDLDASIEDRDASASPFVPSDEEVDLDAEIEDADGDADSDADLAAGVENLDTSHASAFSAQFGSLEYDSDDVRLMRAMDASVDMEED